MTAATAGELLVAETFGPTVQGEGPSLGQRAVFVRLMNCNLSCRSCDTPYTWDGTRFDLEAETQRITVDELVGWALRQPADLVVVTGGEPLIQQRRLGGLVVGLTAAGLRVEVETNGTILPSQQLLDGVTAFNVSPKLSRFGAGMAASRRVRPEALSRFVASGKAVFKFVAATPADLDEIAELVTRFELSPVWVMPEGTTAAVVTRRLGELADAVVERGFNLTTRLHVLAWGDQRGR